MIEAEHIDYIRVPVTDMGHANHFLDVAAAKAKLESAGPQVGEMWDSGVCQAAGVTDPAGNRILLHHRYAPYPDGSMP